VGGGFAYRADLYARINSSKAGHLMDSWFDDFMPGEHEGFFASLETGWTNNKLSCGWRKYSTDAPSKKQKMRDFRLLITDGHSSCITMSFLDYCNQYRIVVAIFPPHSAHRLQHLAVSILNPLANYYSQQLDQYVFRIQGLSGPTERDFWRNFCM
jgi:DDE superfamily endonuclease